MKSIFKSRVTGVFFKWEGLYLHLLFFHGDAKACFDPPAFLQSFRKTCKQQHLQPCYEYSLLLGSRPSVYILVCCSPQRNACIYND